MSEWTTSPSFQGFLRRRRGRGLRSDREAAVTTEGDEVVVTLGLVTFQTTRHGIIVTSNILGLHPCAMKPRIEDSGVPGAAVGGTIRLRLRGCLASVIRVVQG
jgi:hypothetical protein